MADDNQTQIDNLDDALEALRNARKDAATQRTQKANALNRVERLSTALRAAGLDPDSDDLDTRAAALKTAGSSQEDAAEAQETIDILRELLGEYAERTGIDPDDILSALEALPENATEQQQQEAVAGAFKGLDALKQAAYEGQLTLMAQAVGKDREALREVLDGKPVELRKVTQDGQETEVWGIAQGDEFKPLTELRSVQLLGSAETPTPARPAYPAQVVTGSKPTPKTEADVRREKLTEAAALI